MKLAWLVPAVLVHASAALELHERNEGHVAQWRISRSDHDGALNDSGSSSAAQPIVVKPQRDREKEAQALRGQSGQVAAGAGVAGPGRLGREGGAGQAGAGGRSSASPPRGAPMKAPTYGPLDPRGESGRKHVLSLVAVGLAVLTWWYIAHFMTNKHDERDPIKRTHRLLPEDIYGFAVASIVRDSQVIAAGRERTGLLRYSRVLASLLLSCVNLGMLMFIIFQIKQFVTAKWVHDIRVDYDHYEVSMYSPGQTTLTATGHHRGVPGHLIPANFNFLEQGLKERVCNIPFSQGAFFHAVLLVWGLTCIAEVRQCLSMFMSLVIATPTLKSMEFALEDIEDIPEEDHHEQHPVRVVAGLTVTIKFVLGVFVIIPRLVLTLVLLWLGSRFLAATNDFCEMVLNAAALEFLLMLKDLLFFTVVPDRNKREVANIEIRPSTEVEHAGYWTYLGTFGWLFVAFSWNVYYIFLFQNVLPDFRWDVELFCSPWLDNKYGSSA